MAVDYAELHLHTAYSFLDGASLPEDLIARAAGLGYRALAVTDHDGLYGAMEFAQLARAAGIQPITGVELTLLDGSHLTLLAETSTGYRHLCRLITEAYRDQPHGQARLEPRLLEAHAKGLILLTGCRRGPLARLLDAGRFPEAEEEIGRYITWFGRENVVVELQQNLVYGDTRRVRSLVQLAERFGLRYAATGNVHYHERTRHRLQDVLVAIRHRTTLDGSHRERRANAEFYLRSPAEMARLFQRYPAALAATREIAERCASFDLTRDLTYTFPAYDTAAGETADDALARVCRRKLVARYGAGHLQAQRRLDEELRLIQRHGLAGFFLHYRDLLQLARRVADEVRGTDGPRGASNLPPGRGRGSSVSSIVCYLIGLSHVDPLAHDLFVGRFLNEEIGSVPDIDLDFPREIRERLIERVYERYGPDHAALVCAFATYKLRGAVRDVGKALGIPPADLDKIAKLSGSHAPRDLDAELARIPEYAARRGAPPWRDLVALAGQLAGFPRHLTQHVGGMIISSTPLIESVPVQPAAMAGRYICQWDKDSCDDARFIKIDFLALGMLSLIEECLELIVAAGKAPVDLSRIDFDDPAVYQMICEGDTIGVFQIESRAQIQMLPQTQPRNLNDLIVQVAIVRPGPIVGGAVSPYVRNRQQRLRHGARHHLEYDHPLLEDVLAETYGVILYQEQVLQVAMRLAGFSAGQAEGLRRAMSRRRSHQAMAHFERQFLEGARARGVDADVAARVFDKLLGFAEFGFPKSHAAAFAILAYQSAWLKRYHPAEFICALLNNQPMGFYPRHVLSNDAKRHGVRMLPPDINRSMDRCTVEGNAVRLGLGHVAELGAAAARAIALERQARGPYRSLGDLVRRVPLKRVAAEHLCLVGAFDGFGLGRREALWQLGLVVPPRRVATAGTKPGEASGRQLALALPVEQDMVALAPMPSWERMTADYEILGLSPRYHPLGLLRPHLAPRILSTAELESEPDGALVQVAGLVVCRQRPATAKNITFLLLEDEHGLVNVIIYPKLYEEQRRLARREPFLLVLGTLQTRGGTINILARRLRALRETRTAFTNPRAREFGLFDRSATAGAAPEETTPPARSLDGVSPASHDFR